MAEDIIFEGNVRDCLPFNLEAEQSVLGSILVDSKCLPEVFDYITSPDSFYKEVHKKLFSIISVMFASNKPIDFVTVLDEAISDKKLFESAEDARLYLTQLVEMVPAVVNVGAYARIVREKHYIRKLALIAGEILNESRGGHADADELLNLAEAKIYGIRQGKNTDGLVKIDEVMINTFDELQKLSGADREKYRGISSGYTYLDKTLTGLNKSDLILIAARPAMGKTAFALNMATNASKQNRGDIAIFSLEMSREQLVSRILSSEASVESTKLRTGELTEEEWKRIAAAGAGISTLPVYIDDTPGLTVNEMKSKLRRLPNLSMVVIDYLQLMTTGRKSDGNRVQEVSEITRNLKIMAKELNVPVITLSQLSRGPESRQDHRPMLSDLRESGSIEQDADIVLALYRDAYYNKESEQQNIAECIVLKNRHGEVGTVKMGWDSRFTRFTNLEIYRDEN